MINTPHKSASAYAGPLAVMACAFLWSTGGLFIKVLDWNPFLIAGLRSLTAAVLLWIVLGRPRFTLSPAQLLAAGANTLTMILFVVANKTTTAANAILLQYVAPLFTALLAWIILKEKLKPHQLAAMVLSLAGLALMFSEKLSPGQMLGNILALTSGLTFAVYFTFMRFQKDGSPLESTLLSQVFTAGIGLSVAAFLPLPQFTLPSLGALLFLGLVQIGLAGILFAYGIRRVSALTANLLAIIEPVFNPLWVFLILGEVPSPLALTGGLIILVSVTGASLWGLKTTPRESA